MAGFPFFVAKRYLISKKSTNVINLISGISVFGVTTGTMAMIIVLAIFSGLNSLIESIFSAFDPEIKITASEGKRFEFTDDIKSILEQHEQIAVYSKVLEDNALIRYDDAELIATVKGVDDQFVKLSGLDSMLFDGDFVLKEGKENFAILGKGIASRLVVGLNFISPFVMYYPKNEINPVNIERSINRKLIYPSAIFEVSQEIDFKYILVPIEFARDLFDEKNKISSLEIKLKEVQQVDDVIADLKSSLGSAYHIKSRIEQQELLFKTIQTEKLMSYLILGFIVMIASFNVIGSLTMLIIDKKKDIITLKNLGASLKEIRMIFLLEGWLISIVGTLGGVIIGLLFCLIQDQIGIIPLKGDGAFIVEYYPVKVFPMDVLKVLGLVLGIGFIASWYPVRYLTKRLL